MSVCTETRSNATIYVTKSSEDSYTVDIGYSMAIPDYSLSLYHANIPADDASIHDYEKYIDALKACVKDLRYQLSNIDGEQTGPGGQTGPRALKIEFSITPYRNIVFNLTPANPVEPIPVEPTTNGVVIVPYMFPISKSLKRLCINNYRTFRISDCTYKQNGLTERYSGVYTSIWGTYDKTVTGKTLYHPLAIDSCDSKFVSYCDRRNRISGCPRDPVFIKIDSKSIAIVYEYEFGFINQLTELEELVIYDKDLTTLDLTKCTKLRRLTITAPELTTLSLCQNSVIEFMDIYETKINYQRMMEIVCRSSQLKKLVISDKFDIKTTECNGVTKFIIADRVPITMLSYNSAAGWSRT